MPPVEEWSCLVTIEERMVRLEETTEAQESSHDVSMPRINRSFGSDDVDMLLRKEMFDARRRAEEWEPEEEAKPNCSVRAPLANLAVLRFHKRMLAASLALYASALTASLQRYLVRMVNAEKVWKSRIRCSRVSVRR